MSDLVFWLLMRLSVVLTIRAIENSVGRSRVVTEPVDLEQVVRDLVLRMWIVAVERKRLDPSAIEPEEADRLTRELLQRYPPVPTGEAFTYDLRPFWKEAAKVLDLDVDQLERAFQGAAPAIEAERSAAVEAVEDLLRGEQ